MFTGLIEGTGTLLRTERVGLDAKMVIRAALKGEFVLGESIAVDGACLTVTAFGDGAFTADVSAETLSRTTLGRKTQGSRLNLERALRLGDRLGGHLVSGHIDGIGVLGSRHPEGRSIRLAFSAPPEILRYVIGKGSIAVNGISLTVNGVSGSGFDVNIVPHTASETTVEDLRIGEEVNIETDLIGKYVEKMMRPWVGTEEKREAEDRIDVDFLKKHGFI
ncbi:MAG: riboflavin synthase [Desulfobacteraceae bacterium]|nr:riboflavin synthase [Desulfobacteraceae bacterium]